MLSSKNLKLIQLYMQRLGTRLFLTRKNKREHTLLAQTLEPIEQLEALFQGIDLLQKAILKTRKRLPMDTGDKVGLEMMNMQTYLFHIGRVLIQIREQAFHFQYRMSQNDNGNCAPPLPFQRVLQSVGKCLVSIQMLTNMIDVKRTSKLRFDKIFFSMVNTLELNAAELASHMRQYNQFYAEKETLNEIFNLDKLFLEKFLSKSVDLNMMTIDNHLESEALSKEKQCGLTIQAEAIQNPSYFKFSKEIIGLFHELKKCYVVSRKSIINNTLDSIGDDIQTLISALCEIHLEENRDEALRSLHSIYGSLESIRFSTNTESRCSRNLFEKSKLARTKLRQACFECDVGQTFLKQIAMRKTLYMKRK